MVDNVDVIGVKAVNDALEEHLEPKAWRRLVVLLGDGEWHSVPWLLEKLNEGRAMKLQQGYLGRTMGVLKKQHEMRIVHKGNGERREYRWAIATGDRKPALAERLTSTRVS